MKQVMCNINLYDGDTKAGKWYDVTYDDGDMFGYVDDAGGEVRYVYNDAYWSFREKPEEVIDNSFVDATKEPSQSTLDKLVMLAADALRDDEYQIAIDIINLVKEHKK